MKIAFAKVWAETSTFTPLLTNLDDMRSFGLHYGAQILDVYRGVAELGGFLAAAEAFFPQTELIPIIHANGWTGGVLSTEALQHIESHLLAGLEQAGELDGFYFALHGATASEQIADVSGYLLEKVRKFIGPSTPLVASFDHHGNITQRIIDNLDAFVSYQCAPHIDMFETGERAGKLLFRLIQKEINPVIAWQKIPLVTPSYRFTTTKPPLKTLFQRARELERISGVLTVSTFQVFPHLDVPELGWSTIAIADGDLSLANRLAIELAQHSWKIRDQMFPETVPPDEAIRRALASEKGPILMVDGDDNVNGGAPGDSTCFLSALLRAHVDRPAYLTIVDPEAVAGAIAAGIGNVVTLEVGGKRDHIYSRPVPVTGQVIRISDGRFQIGGHGAGSVNMGRTVVLAIGEIRLLLSERIGPGHDPEVYRHIGLDPGRAQIVLVKCTAGHAVAYQSIMQNDLFLDCPGLAFNNLKRLEWKHIPRPIYPIDDLTEWSPLIA
jgi:microcystin degradation protein MlrC